MTDDIKIQQVIARLKGVDLKQVRKAYAQLTDFNEHTAAAKLLVRHFGTLEELATLNEIAAHANRKGYITQEDSRRRFEIANKYYALIQ